MKINAWKTIDVECEVDVSIDDCINELIDIANEDGMPQRKISAIDGATKILEKITPEIVANKLAAYPESIDTIRRRLQKWIAACETHNP